MKKIGLIIFVFIFSFGLAFFFNKHKCINNKAQTYLIKNKNHCLLTANNQEQWEKGLMFYKKPVNFDGMIFIFPEKEVKSFWNKNTYLDLDIYWMDETKIIGKSYLPSILKSKTTAIVKSPGEVNRVVEIIK
ncbi:MAG: DUF192 domain-containing protein [Patescibacteria group bacterium]